MAEVYSEPVQWNRTSNTYDWDKWLDGQVWKLSPEQDFGIDPGSVADPLDQARKYVYQAASRRKVRARTRTQDGALLVQAYPLAAEDTVEAPGAPDSAAPAPEVPA